MFLGFTTLLTALCISGIAAYYSIVGLTAIFAGTFWPIVIMGGVLEAGKVVTTLWLHYNWDRASYKIKTYLVTAVGVLMLITSMGIFGFLSKSHLDQATPTGDIQAQVSLFDEKIKTQRDNIDSSRKALVQMDGSVDQLLARTTDETGATKAANLRRSQQKERAKLQADIDAAQKEISVLQEKRAPLASQFRKVEAEVGPIKYIAALIYGANTDQNMLEAAVRWVIIIIVFVFDPLAIVLILAATTSIDWSKVDRRQLKAEKAAIVDRNLIEQQISDSLELSKRQVDEAIELTRQQCAAQWEQERLAIANENSKLLEEAVAADAKTTEELTATRSGLIAEVTELTSTVNDLISVSTSLTADLSSLEKDCATAIKKQNDLGAELLALVASYDEMIDSKLLSEDQFVANVADLEQKLSAAAVTIDELLKLIPTPVEPERATIADAVVSVLDDSADYADFVEPEQIIEEQPLSGTLTDPEVSRKAFNAVYFYDRPDYFKPKEVEPAVEPEVIEDIPSNEELLKLAAETRDDFYSTTFAVIDQISKDVVPTVAAVEPTPAPVPLTIEPLPDDYGSITAQPAPLQVVMPSLPTKRIVEQQVDIPDFSAKVDTFPLGGNASFGIQFPQNPLRGDLFLRVDYLPSKLFKWVGSRWIEIDKNNTDAFAYDEEYIKLLVDKVSSGEYDIDDLNATEQEQIAVYLRKSLT